MTDEFQDEPEKVGYGSPPRHTRFKPGVSGNPIGPKTKKLVNSFSEAVAAEGDRKYAVVVNGKKRKLPLRQILAQQLWKEAATGAAWATALIAKLDVRSETIEEPEEYPVYEVTLVLEEENEPPKRITG